MAQGHRRLVLDASHMGFISSGGCAIMCAQREACLRGGRMRVCGLDAQVRRIFKMAGLDEGLHLGDTRQEAIQGW